MSPLTQQEIQALRDGQRGLIQPSMQRHMNTQNMLFNNPPYPQFPDGYNDPRMYQGTMDQMEKGLEYNRNIPYGSDLSTRGVGMNFGVSHTMNPALANTSVPNQPTPGYMNQPTSSGMFDRMMDMGRQIGAGVLGAASPAANILRAAYNTYNAPQSTYEDRLPVGDNWVDFMYDPYQQNPSMYQQGTIPAPRTMYGYDRPMGIYPPARPRDVEKL